MLIFSCHADTGFLAHALQKLPDGSCFGQLDNYAGVYCLMQAYFSGRLHQDYVRIELTYGEEIDFAGAKKVRKTLKKNDVVIVLDVTGAPTAASFTVEKCVNPKMRRFMRKALAGLSFDLYEDCPDPVASADESDVYSKKCPRTTFLGIKVSGGDYNAGPVFCQPKDLEAVTEAICRIAETYHTFFLK
jgi:hypothetical protein